MARVKRGVTSHARHKKVLALAAGYRGRSSTNYRIALERVEKALQYAYRDRRNKKRDFRALWIKKAGIVLDRKVLAELAVSEPAAFVALVEEARASLKA